MPRRARRQLNGPRGAAAILLLAGSVACGRSADAPAGAAQPAAPQPAAPQPATTHEAACTSAPLTVRVDGVRREGGDSLRVDLTLLHAAAAPGGATTGSAAVEAAARALEGMSLVTADGRRRLFALHSSSGERVGPPVEAPPPGASRAFWVLFPAAEGSLTVLLPGCAPLMGLAVTPGIRAGRPEP